MDIRELGVYVMRIPEHGNEEERFLNSDNDGGRLRFRPVSSSKVILPRCRQNGDPCGASTICAVLSSRSNARLPPTIIVRTTIRCSIWSRRIATQNQMLLATVEGVYGITWTAVRWQQFNSHIASRARTA